MGKIVCTNCGSSNVECMAWIKPNEMVITNGEDLQLDIENRCYCIDCEGNHKLEYVEDSLYEHE